MGGVLNPVIFLLLMTFIYLSYVVVLLPVVIVLF